MAYSLETDPFAPRSPYAASKHALVGLSSSLRRELGPTGPRITMIEPGAVRTPLWDKAREASIRIDRDLPAAGRREYGVLVEKTVENLTGSSNSGFPEAIQGELSRY